MNIHFRGERGSATRSVGKSLGPGDFGMLGMDAVAPAPAFPNDEAAGRAALQDYLEDHGDEGLRAATSPDRPEVVPDLRIAGISSTPGLTARTVAFEQSNQSIPVFGGRVLVDIDADDKSLLSINGKVAPPPDADGLSGISAADAWQILVARGRDQGVVLAGSPPSPPVLTWFMDDQADRWRLVYHFAAIGLAPPDEALPADLPFDLPAIAAACVTSCQRSALYDYFVDAQDGEICFCFSSAASLDIPVPMSGLDYSQQVRTFFGLPGQAGFYLIDPIRKVETYDFQGADISAPTPPPFPQQAISSATNNLATRPDAVSAHYHAQLVYDFYNDVLKRDGVDDKGMKLISAVNTYSSDGNPLAAPQWANAVWSQGRMWYGQQNGVSFAKYLDVIAHELTHGVTETSSGLIYRRLSGALNESYSDIFGIVIANWNPGKPNPIDQWQWSIGDGLGKNGGPIRHLGDPALTGQPAHMNQYRDLPINYDNGGVHIYSGIHNRAAYLMMTDRDGAGDYSFPIGELVLLLYLTLVRLTPTSNFSDSRRTLENVVGIYHQSNTATRDARLAVIARAYDAVGID